MLQTLGVHVHNGSHGAEIAWQQRGRGALEIGLKRKVRPGCELTTVATTQNRSRQGTRARPASCRRQPSRALQARLARERAGPTWTPGRTLAGIWDQRRPSIAGQNPLAPALQPPRSCPSRFYRVLLMAQLQGWPTWSPIEMCPASKREKWSGPFAWSSRRFRQTRDAALDLPGVINAASRFSNGSAGVEIERRKKRVAVKGQQQSGLTTKAKRVSTRSGEL
jgi:hypothetical protein